MFLDKTLLGPKSIFLEDYDPPHTPKLAKKKEKKNDFKDTDLMETPVLVFVLFFRMLIQKKTCSPSLKGVNMEIDNNKQRSVRSKNNCFQSPRLLKWNIVHNWIGFQMRMLRVHGSRDQNGSKEMLKLKQYEN